MHPSRLVGEQQHSCNLAQPPILSFTPLRPAGQCGALMPGLPPPVAFRRHPLTRFVPSSCFTWSDVLSSRLPHASTASFSIPSATPENSDSRSFCKRTPAIFKQIRRLSTCSRHSSGSRTQGCAAFHASSGIAASPSRVIGSLRRRLERGAVVGGSLMEGPSHDRRYANPAQRFSLTRGHQALGHLAPGAGKPAYPPHGAAQACGSGNGQRGDTEGRRGRERLAVRDRR